MQQTAIANEPSEIRRTRSLWEYSVVVCAFMQRRIIFPLFMPFMGPYFIHEFLRASEPHLTLCVYVKSRKLFHLPTTVAGFQNTPDVWTIWPAKYDWWVSEQSKTHEWLFVTCQSGEAKPAMDKNPQFDGGNFQLCFKIISVFCPALRCVSLSPPSLVTP